MHLRPFSLLTPTQLAAVVALYRSAFEAPWEWPWRDVSALAGAETSRQHFWARALLLDGDAAGFAIAGYLTQSNLWYLHYFAIAPALRGRGLGTWLLGQTITAGETAATEAGRLGCRGTLIEVEALSGPPPGANRAERERRQAFYRRSHAISTGLRYPRPPGAAHEMPEWDILLIPGAAWKDALDRETRQGLVRALCVEGYGLAPDTVHLLEYLAAC
jgi:GNAT superfamily N-acetyltransferase